MSAPKISAVVLAGTHRWSGSSFERLAPRPLVPVALAPLITYPLRWLREAGVGRATICANGTTRDIESEFADGHRLGMELSYYKDSTPRGRPDAPATPGSAATPTPSWSWTGRPYRPST